MMLEAFKRWFGRKGGPEEKWPEVQHWADTRQFAWREVQNADGFLIEGRHGTLPWRLEWGPSQRGYLKGSELRLRADISVPSELQALVLNRRLQERMESEVFDQFVEDLQTRADTRTPPEMRWLVMYTPLTGHELRDLRDRWAAVSNVKTWVEHWLSGALGSELKNLKLEPTHPVVFMVARKRLTLRVGLSKPDISQLETWLHLFECSAREARRVGATGCDSQEDVTEPGMFVPTGMPSGQTASAH